MDMKPIPARILFQGVEISRKVVREGIARRDLLERGYRLRAFLGVLLGRVAITNYTRGSFG